jgi:uncharacterized protein
MIKLFFLFGFLGLMLFAHAGTEKKVVFTVGNKVHEGILALPDGDGPFPLMVLVPFLELQGKDQALDIKDPELVCLYRDLEGKRIRISKEISDYYTEKGIAVFRYDRNSVNFVDEDQTQKVPTDELKTIHLGIEFCKSQEGVDSSVIILWGFGSGGWLTYQIAEKRTDLDYIITYGMPFRSLEETLESKIRFTFDHCGDTDPEAKDEALKSMKATLSDVEKNKISSGELVAGQFPKYWKGLMQLAQNSALKYKKCGIPSLTLYGNADFEIAEKDVAEAREWANARGKVEYLSGLNHYLNNGTDPHVHPSVFKSVDRFFMKNQ